MKRFLRTRRIVAGALFAAFLVAAGIGLWPVRADVFGNGSYSCGSGFVHSNHTWNVDSASLSSQRSGSDTGTGLPSSVCPDKVDNRRDLALLVMAFSLAFGLLALLTLDRPPEPNFGSTLFANRRRSTVRAPMPARPAQSDEAGIQ